VKKTVRDLSTYRKGRESGPAGKAASRARGDLDTRKKKSLDRLSCKEKNRCREVLSLSVRRKEGPTLFGRGNEKDEVYRRGKQSQGIAREMLFLLLEKGRRVGRPTSNGKNREERATLTPDNKIPGT